MIRARKSKSLISCLKKQTPISACEHWGMRIRSCAELRIRSDAYRLSHLCSTKAECAWCRQVSWLVTTSSRRRLPRRTSVMFRQVGRRSTSSRTVAGQLPILRNSLFIPPLSGGTPIPCMEKNNINDTIYDHWQCQTSAVKNISCASRGEPLGPSRLVLEDRRIDGT